MEKDGPTAWCEPVAPSPWQGQRIVARKGKEKEDGTYTREQACEMWNPQQLEGQCFGLGAKQEGAASASSEGCRDACCGDQKCTNWQYREDKGCFYSSAQGFNCETLGEHAFQPFQGRRKVVLGRIYVDHRGVKVVQPPNG
jgi:hypothetical protein